VRTLPDHCLNRQGKREWQWRHWRQCLSIPSLCQALPSAKEKKRTLAGNCLRIRNPCYALGLVTMAFAVDLIGRFGNVTVDLAARASRFWLSFAVDSVS
jgi:hypothetical protein